jgi:hypothetical protein
VMTSCTTSNTSNSIPPSDTTSCRRCRDLHEDAPAVCTSTTTCRPSRTAENFVRQPEKTGPVRLPTPHRRTRTVPKGGGVPVEGPQRCGQAWRAAVAIVGGGL